MKLLSQLPALIAKISELVARDVTSDVEVIQTTAFPLLKFSHALRPRAPLATTLNVSAIIATDGSVANGAASVVLRGRVNEGCGMD